MVRLRRGIISVTVYKYMTHSPNRRDEPGVPPKSSTVILLLGDIADTTWRMFVPTVGGLLIGSFADGQLGSKPWGLLIGAVVGIALTTLLIQKLFQKVRRK